MWQTEANINMRLKVRHPIKYILLTALFHTIYMSTVGGLVWLIADTYGVQGVCVNTEVEYAYCEKYDWVETEQNPRPRHPSTMFDAEPTIFIAIYGERGRMCLSLKVAVLYEKHSCCCFFSLATVY